MLEDRDRQSIYLLRATLLSEMGRTQDAQIFINQIGWPPLAKRFGGADRRAARG